MADHGDCVFCKIISGLVPANVVSEDERCVAILDAFPVAHGHTLVLLKAHRRNMLDTAAEDLAAMTAMAGRLAPALLRSTGAQGLNMVCNNESCAGQVVGHIHFHLIPRFENDGLKHDWAQKSYGPGEAEDVCRKIRAEIEGVK